MTISVQWMERTLDDSANRRISIPEGFLCTDAVLRILQRVTADIYVNTDVINKTVMTYLPFIATENLMMEGVKRGGNRQTLHEIIRRCSMQAIAAMDKGEPCDLLKMLAEDPDFPLSEAEMTDVLNPAAYIGRCPEQVQALVDKTKPLFKGASRENAEINI
jgi:adenylosuccinate lyase